MLLKLKAWAERSVNYRLIALVSCVVAFLGAGGAATYSLLSGSSPLSLGQSRAAAKAIAEGEATERSRVNKALETLAVISSKIADRQSAQDTEMSKAAERMIRIEERVAKVEAMLTPAQKSLPKPAPKKPLKKPIPVTQ